MESASEESGVFTRAHRCTGHRLSRSCSAPAQRLVATPRGPRMTPALCPVNAARYYNATLHQRYNATLHQTNARHTAPVWRPTCSTERRRRLQSAVPAGATNAHKLHYRKSFIRLGYATDQKRHLGLIRLRIFQMRWASVANDHLGPKPLILDTATRRSL